MLRFLYASKKFSKQSNLNHIFIWTQIVQKFKQVRMYIVGIKKSTQSVTMYQKTIAQMFELSKSLFKLDHALKHFNVQYAIYFWTMQLTLISPVRT